MKVRIFKPSRTAMQSGRGKAKEWQIEPELETARTPEPLMGWVASGDTLNQIRLHFATAEEAVKFAARKGWVYTLDEAQERKVTPRNYADNFRARQKAQ